MRLEKIKHKKNGNRKAIINAVQLRVLGKSSTILPLLK